MFRPRTMAQVEILLLQRDLDRALRALAEARIIHLHRMTEAGVGGSRQESIAVERFNRLKALLAHLSSELGCSAAGARVLASTDLPGWETWAEELQHQLRALLQRQEQLRRRRDYLRFLSLFLRRMRRLPLELAELRTLHFFGVRLCLLPLGAFSDIAMLAQGLSVYPLKQIGDSLLLVLLFPRRIRTELEQRIAEAGGTLLPLPKKLSGSVNEVLPRLVTLHKHVHNRMQRVEAKMSELRIQNEALLRDRLHTVAAECHLLKAGDGFGFTGRTVAIGGWIPQRRTAELEDIFRRICGERFILRHVVARGGDTPVLLYNPLPVRPFQRLLAVLGTPAYAEFEPTPLLAVGFLLLFGMMFGDVGHGLLFLAGGFLLRRSSRWRDYGLILAEVGLFSILFGLLFGSFFGREDLFEPLWFSPLHDIPRLMLAALILGATLILTGLSLRIFNGLRSEPFWVVVTDRFGLAGLVFYGGGLISGYLVYRQVLPASALVWLTVPLVFIFCHPFAERQGKHWVATGMLLAEGAMEVLETILGFLTNTLSFLRVAAFGLAHAGLFLAVFALADQVRSLPLGPFWVAVVQVLGNVVILVLEGLVVSIQAVRLEFYEIFSKFFRGGGVVYSPLALEPGRERSNGDAQQSFGDVTHPL